MLGNSFDSGHSVTMVEIGDASVAIGALDEAAGTNIGISIDRYLVFGPDDKLIVAAG